MTRSSLPHALHLGVDLTGAGAHPAVWRTLGSQAARLFDPERLDHLVATAQRGLLDFVLFDDAFSLQPSTRNGLQGRLDAALVAARVAPRSAGIGLVAAIDTIHTEPFHVAKAVGTIDHVSGGRAAWQVGSSTSPVEAAHVGRRPAPSVTDALAETADVIEVVRRLWDTWEDDAEIRDVASGRYVDRTKLHYADFEGVHFAVKGPSITPRPPQGQPPVVVRATTPAEIDLAGRGADVVRVRASDLEGAASLHEQVRAAAAAAGRDPDEVVVLLDVYVVVGHDRVAAAERLELLDLLGEAPWEPGSLVRAGTAADLAALLTEGVASGAVDGYTVHPSSLESDLHGVVDGVVPILQSEGTFRRAYPGSTLRDTLGLARPANRYAAIG